MCAIRRRFPVQIGSSRRVSVRLGRVFAFAVLPAFGACAAANTPAHVLPHMEGDASLEADDATLQPPDGGVPDPDASNSKSHDANLHATSAKANVIPPAIEELEYACGLLLSCGSIALPPSVVPPDFGECVHKLGNELSSATAINYSLSVRECALGSASCSKLSACLLRGVKPSACKGRATGDKVVGLCDVSGQAVTCYRERVLLVRDCPRGGEECAVRQGDATCTFGACTTQDTTPHCTPSQTRLVRCERGKLVGIDCGLFGLSCAETTKGAACTTKATCEGNARRCENGTAVVCHDGHEVRVDCDAAGLDCEPSAANAERVGECFVSPSRDACDSSSKTTCDGSTISACVHGKKTAFSCKAINLSRCEHSANGIRCAI